MNPETRLAWGKRLKNRRAGLSQTTLGRLCGVDQSTISRIENGTLPRISDDLKWKLAGALRCTVSDIFPYPDVCPPFPEEVAA